MMVFKKPTVGRVGRLLSGGLPASLAVGFLFLYTSWMSGGVYFYKQPMLWVGLALLLIVIAHGITSNRKMFRSMCFWSSMAVVVYFFIPVVNVCQGMIIAHFPAQDMILYKPPLVWWLPSAILRNEAIEVFMWAVCAASVALAFKYVITKKQANAIFDVVIVNGLVLAIAGLAYYAFGIKLIPWMWQWNNIAGTHLFSVFAYSNASGMFFVLLLCLVGMRMK